MAQLAISLPPLQTIEWSLTRYSYDSALCDFSADDIVSWWAAFFASMRRSRSALSVRIQMESGGGAFSMPIRDSEQERMEAGIWAAYQDARPHLPAGLELVLLRAW